MQLEERSTWKQGNTKWPTISRRAFWMRLRYLSRIMEWIELTPWRSTTKERVIKCITGSFWPMKEATSTVSTPVTNWSQRSNSFYWTGWNRIMEECSNKSPYRSTTEWSTQNSGIFIGVGHLLSATNYPFLYLWYWQSCSCFSVIFCNSFLCYRRSTWCNKWIFLKNCFKVQVLRKSCYF